VFCTPLGLLFIAKTSVHNKAFTGLEYVDKHNFIEKERLDAI
jgi:hypothetical protein